MRETAVQARERVWGLSPTMAKEQHAGTLFGRMFLQRELAQNPDRNKVMFDAGMDYYAARKAYLRSILARSLPSGGDLERHSGFDGSDGADPAYIASCESSERLYLAMRNSIIDHAGFAAYAAIKRIVCDDEDVPKMIGDLRMALNALCRRAETRRAA